MSRYRSELIPGVDPTLRPQPLRTLANFPSETPAPKEDPLPLWGKVFAIILLGAIVAGIALLRWVAMHGHLGR